MRFALGNPAGPSRVIEDMRNVLRPSGEPGRPPARPTAWVAAILAVVILVAGIGPSTAQTSSRAAATIPATPAGEQLAWALEQVNTRGDSLTPLRIERRFAPLFLSGITSEALIDVFRYYVGPAGPMEVARFEGGVTDRRAHALLATPAGYWRVALSVEDTAEHRINGLFFQPAYVPTGTASTVKSWSALKRDFAALAPQAGFMAAELTADGCLPLARVDHESPLAIASAFKLYVLGELGRQVQSGLASWAEPLAFDSSLISLPNGDMRYSLPGEPFPLITYAEQMIAQSDNTATDHLIARLGREAVESAFDQMGHASPELNVPLLMTREWFAIKMRLTDREIRRYELATVDKRRELLETLVQPQAATLAEWEPWPAFRAINSIEWFASAQDLCNAMHTLWQASEEPGMEPILNALSLQPGITFDPAAWSYVGYKGGYEAGVRSDVWLLQRADGRWFALAGIINDLTWEIDGFGMADLMVAAAELLTKEK